MGSGYDIFVGMTGRNIIPLINECEVIIMKHIITLNSRDIKKSAKEGGCGECQTSCQSACKTSCGIANQACEQKKA